MVIFMMIISMLGMFSIIVLLMMENLVSVMMWILDDIMMIITMSNSIRIMVLVRMVTLMRITWKIVVLKGIMG